ncbi:MAG: hypothetical protein QOI10_4400 [Solirubrobacterales bacterium]|jgi:hypothetical protein|nr:hypothetical protein [Solirubrobacterales bacterium]
MTGEVRGESGYSGSAGALRAGLDRSGMSHSQLWINYLTLGGELSEKELDAGLRGNLVLGCYEYNMIGQALNDQFIDRGEGHPIPYFEQLDQRRANDWPRPPPQLSSDPEICP